MQRNQERWLPVEMPISAHVAEIMRSSDPFVRFLHSSRWITRLGAEEICDFVVGNPQEMAMPAYVDAIRKASVPTHSGWFGYKLNEPVARDAASRALSERLGMPFVDEDLFLTKGASSAFVLALSTVLEPGEEVIFQSPPWFFYEAMIAFCRGVPVRVRVNPASFDLDIDAIVGAITPRTRAVVVNSPNNPTGKIYPPDTLDRLGAALRAASENFGRAIYLISDEAYNRILFAGRKFESPTGFYEYSFLLYSYAKALLTPGQRLGYLAVSPLMPERERMRAAVVATQYAGYGVPDAVLQHALPELEPLCIDIAALERRMEVMVQMLVGLGYDVCVPDGAFYLLARSPLRDDMAFVDMLAAHDVFVLPGSIVELPGYFRICLTANDDMVERSQTGFAAAIKGFRAVNAAGDRSLGR
ncbi:MAG: aminotransferase class I/II-fold pyridoxal phosphate-dependent enzyme [Actinobacteria bacterium]|nr:aminotransferase class I/II-fold pyridoxal phosphate-dependent enzyme [Actinomycetota bacterium]